MSAREDPSPTPLIAADECARPSIMRVRVFASSSVGQDAWSRFSKATRAGAEVKRGRPGGKSAERSGMEA